MCVCVCSTECPQVPPHHDGGKETECGGDLRWWRKGADKEEEDQGKEREIKEEKEENEDGGTGEEKQNVTMISPSQHAGWCL